MNIVDRMTITLTTMQLKGHQPRAIYLNETDWRECWHSGREARRTGLFMGVPLRAAMKANSIATKRGSSVVYDKQGRAHTIRKWRRPLHDKKVKG